MNYSLLFSCYWIIVYLYNCVVSFFNVFKKTKEDCPICLEPIKQSCDTKCGHKYCTSCFVTLVRQTNKCAICRGDILDGGEAKKEVFTKECRDLISQLMIDEAIHSSRNGAMKNIFHDFLTLFFGNEPRDENKEECYNECFKMLQSDLFWRCISHIIIKTCDITVYCYEKELWYLNSTS